MPLGPVKVSHKKDVSCFSAHLYPAPGSTTVGIVIKMESKSSQKW